MTPERAGGCHFSPDSKQLATVTKDGELRLWNTASQEMVSELPDANCEARPLAGPIFSPDGKSLALVYEDAVEFWDRILTKQLGQVEIQFNLYSRSMAFSSDGRVFAIGEEDKVTLLDTDKFNVRATLKAGNTSSLAFSPDG